jgi:hypothetical protein
MQKGSPHGSSIKQSGLARGASRPLGSQPDYTPTPDRRYFVVRGRLWRLSNPFLDPATHERWVRDLMLARRALADATSREQRISARLRVDAAKRALGERGSPWWSDGAPDYNRKLAVNTPYAAWFTQAN